MLCTIFVCMLFVLGVEHRTYRLLPGERLTSKRVYRNSLMKLLWVTILVESESLQESLDRSWGAALARNMCLRRAHRPNQQWSWAVLDFFTEPQACHFPLQKLCPHIGHLLYNFWPSLSGLTTHTQCSWSFYIGAMANNWLWRLVKVLNLMESRQAVLGELSASVICVVILPAISITPIPFQLICSNVSLNKIWPSFGGHQRDSCGSDPCVVGWRGLSSFFTLHSLFVKYVCLHMPIFHITIFLFLKSYLHKE